MEEIKGKGKGKGKGKAKGEVQGQLEIQEIERLVKQGVEIAVDQIMRGKGKSKSKGKGKGKGSSSNKGNIVETPQCCSPPVHGLHLAANF